jgi:hypothetical protein
LLWDRFGFDIQQPSKSTTSLTLMKRIFLSACTCLASLGLATSEAAEPASPAFPGVQKAMTPEQYEAAGLSKLDPAERAKLDEFIKNYVAVSN